MFIIEFRLFFEFGKFLDSQLKIDEIKSLTTSIKTNKEKIKVGFLSADLRGHHSITYFVRGILANYDRENFSIVLISNQEVDDKTFDEFSKKVDESINISHLSDIKALNSLKDLNELSKFLVDPGETKIKIKIQENDKSLDFHLQNGRKLDRKTVNLIRNKEISSIIH